MGKKLQLIIFLTFLVSPLLIWGQGCPSSVNISANPGTTICEGTSVIFTASTTDGTSLSYQWQVNGSNVSSSGSTFSTASLKNSDKVKVIVTSSDDTDCTITSNILTMTVNPNRTGSVKINADNTNICPGDPVNFQISSITNGGSSPTYEWILTRNSSSSTVGSSSSYSSSTLEDGDQIQLFITSNIPCVTNNPFSSNTISIVHKDGEPSAPTSITIQGNPAYLCPDSSYTFEVNNDATATEYIWGLPTGWSASSTTTTVPSINVTTGSQGGTISAAAKNSCGISDNQTLSVDVVQKPSPPSEIVVTDANGDGIICPGESITLSVINDPEMSSYTWNLPAGWSGSSTANSIQVTDIDFGENGTASVYSTNECLDSDVSSISLSINEPVPGQPGTISGTTPVCPGEDAVYSIGNVQYADSYEWLLDGNVISGVSGTSYTFNSTTAGNYKLEVIAKNECGSSTASSKTITVDDGTPEATSITQSSPDGSSGNTDFCPAETGITFSVSQDARIDTYSWTVPSGWSLTAGAGTNEIIVTAGQLGNDGQIQFTGSSNDCGSVSATYDVFVKNPAPSQPGTIDGPVEICAGSTNTYSIDAVTYAEEYVWTLPDGTSEVTTSPSLNLTTSMSGDLNLSVQARNSCGLSTSSSKPIKSVAGKPTAPGTIISTKLTNEAICPPAIDIDLKVDPVAGADYYEWTFPNSSWVITSSDPNSNSIIIKVDANSSHPNPSSISVKAVNICGKSTASTLSEIAIADHVVVNAGPDQTVCQSTSPISISGSYSFGGSNKNLNPVWSTSGTGIIDKKDKLSTTYTPSSTDVTNGSVTLTLKTDAPSGACGPGKDEMKIFFQPDPTASISATAEVCNGQTAEVTLTATPNTTVTYKIGAGSNQTIQVGDSGSTTITTGNLTSDTTYSLVSVQYTAAPNCSKTISGSSTIIVNPVPSVDISYSNQCRSESNSANVSYSNGVGAWETGIFSASGDLGTNINSEGSFIPANVAPGTYTVTYTITGSGGCADQEVTTDVVIYEEVSISTQPADFRTCEGGNAQFTVNAIGDGLSYEWYKGPVSDGNLVGNTNVLDLTAVNLSDAAEYYVVVSGTAPCSPVISQAATLTVDENINVDSQPVSTTICEGETINLEVIASTATYTGTDFSYQWFKGTPGSGTAISGANSSSLPLNTVSPDDSGEYYVEITGPADYTCSIATSSAASVEVRPAPTVEIEGNTSICDGASADILFSNGTPNAIVTYILNNDSGNPQNVTLDANGKAVLNTGSLYSTSDTDTDFIYDLQSVAFADDPNCTASISGTATVTVAPDPEVSISFTDNQTEFCTADNTAYTPTLNGSGTFDGGSFSSNGLTIDSSTGEFTPGNEVAGNYTIIYTIPAYGGCPEESMSLNISIYEEVTITSQPSNLGICSTSDAEFSITATGDNLTYQWFKVVGDPDINSGVTETNDSPVSGGTSAILSLQVATSEDAGAYYVKVGGTNACTPTEDTQVVSDVVTLNVDEDIVIIEPAEDVRVCDKTNASVEFKFVVHANGAPLIFEWIYDDGTSVNPDGSHMVSDVIERTDYPDYEGIIVYEGTLNINNITSADQASYAVKIDGSANNFTCPEAISNSFNLDVDPLPDFPGVVDLAYCIGDEPPVLTATGSNLTWYDNNGNELAEAPTPSTNSPGDTSYFVSQKDTYCESPKAEIVITVHDLPATPPLTAEELNVEYCLGATASVLTATASADHTIVWYESETALTALESAPTPQTNSAGTIDFWVSQTNNITTCESERLQIIVTINDLPNISIANSGNDTICEGDEIILTASDANDTDSSTSYSWDWTGNTESALTGPSQNFSPTENITYTVTATSENGCINTKDITINVDPQPIGGTLSGPDSVCVTDPNGELNLIDHSGTISRWEYKPESSTSWTAINEDTPDANYQFSGLTESTSFRVVITNGVCTEVYSTEWNVTIDDEPVAGQILFKGTDRVFMMCEFPTDDYLVPLQTAGTYIGEIVAWEYRRNSATEWSTITNDDGSNYTDSGLSGQQVNEAANNESTLFRVEVQSGACSPNVYSDYATLSIIPSDIAPNPVTITKPEICIGDFVELSSGTGYGGYGTFIGGAFDNSSIANHGWRVMRYPGNTEYTFESAADNVRPDRWMRTNPHDYLMANPDGSGNNIYQRFDSCSCDEGNKGFAIVSGDNPSTLETPVFNLYATENPTLTFDQAYNLTHGDTIRVEISMDGGNTYTELPLMEIGGPSNPGDAPNVSTNYARFGDDGLGEPNNMSIDLSQYSGLGNLRIRWLYDGSTGGIYTIDDIGLPEDPENVELIWYYDADPNDPNNELEQIGEVNEGTVQYTPTKIGWNYFQVNTALVFDTNGDPCESAENQATIQVYVFDSYTTTATANVGSCGNAEVPLQGTLTGGAQGEVTEFFAEDTSTVAWTVLEFPDGYTFSEDHFTTTGEGSAINDPNATFLPPVEGEYTLEYTINPDKRNTCEINSGSVNFNFVQCTTLDFDGFNDYVDLGTTSYQGNSYFIEAWIRPFERTLPDGSKTDASKGTIISGPGFAIEMEDFSSTIIPGTRWYHIAASTNGSVYIDGVLQSNINLSGVGGNRTLIGAKWNSTNNTTQDHFSGWIEEVRIWNTPLDPKQIRFMMNQRLKLDDSGIVASPLQGEVVPNLFLDAFSSYNTDGTHNLDADGLAFYDVATSNLAGYYRLYSDTPDPDNLLPSYFDPFLEPSNGTTPDHSGNNLDGRMYNITTDQENTSPTPYISMDPSFITYDATKYNGHWGDKNTWARPDVWDFPNSTSNGTAINWNIAWINHDIQSASKNITMLGLLSETADKELSINPSHFIRISHYLLLDGNMDLEGESQLLQDHGSILDNDSSGWLEANQEGRMSSFNYNYWTSPVTDQGKPNNSGYTLDNVLYDGDKEDTPEGVNFQPGYYVADKPKTSPITISTEWIWDFRGGTADIYGDWTHLGSDFTEIVGAGYSMKGTDGTVAPNGPPQKYTFRGKPNNGNIPTTELYLTNNKNYLVGNPYPSAIDAWDFILDNVPSSSTSPEGESGRNTKAVFNGSLYFWDHFSGSTHILEEYIGGYGVLNLSSAEGIPAISNDWRIDNSDPNRESSKKPKRYIPVAQGFFLNSASVVNETFGGDIIFKNTQRIYKTESADPSIFLQHEEDLIKGKEQNTRSTSSDEDLRMKIRLKFESPKGYHRQILVTRDANTTNNFDIGYDAPLIENNLEDMYWWFDESAFVIQGVSSFEKEQILPLVIKTKDGGEFTIKIDKTENWPTAKELYLNDKLNDSIHDILKKDYIAETEAGEIKDRFELVFFKEMAQDPDPVISDPVELPNIDGLVGISYSTFSKQVKISNFDLLDVSKVMIFDMGGKLIQQYDEIPTEREILLGMRPVRSGVYIIKVFSENGISDKKVVIK